MKRVANGEPKDTSSRSVRDKPRRDFSSWDREREKPTNTGMEYGVFAYSAPCPIRYNRSSKLAPRDKANNASEHPPQGGDPSRTTLSCAAQRELTKSRSKT